MLASSLRGQENSVSVPATIYIQNTYTLQAEKGVEVRFELRQPNGQFFRADTRYTNEQGMVNISLEPNLTYALTSRKAEYFTQVTLLETKELSRTDRNRFNISLRPKACYRLQGQVQGTRNQWQGAYFTLTNLATQERQRVDIDEQGRYYACGKCGETYQIAPIVQGQPQVLDTLYLSPAACERRQNPLLKFNLRLKPQPLVVKRIPEEAPLPRTQEDSLVVENLSFEGKTKKLGAQGQQALEELATALQAEPNLFVELLVHTDSRKSERYNWLLAQKRGALLEKYLQEQGIDPERYVIVPVGEARILNQCTNNKRCSAAEHAVNNRVEMVRHPEGKPVEK
jgi:outer membrane protein OmpA-like peptidoglycan-associated protein